MRVQDPAFNHVGSGQAVVGISPILVAPANPARDELLIANNGDATIYLGGPNVTCETGFLLQVGQRVTIKSHDPVFGVVRAGSQVASHLEFYR